MLLKSLSWLFFTCSKPDKFKNFKTTTYDHKTGHNALTHVWIYHNFIAFTCIKSNTHQQNYSDKVKVNIYPIHLNIQV